jgi:S1-C subfamily serine protease
MRSLKFRTLVMVSTLLVGFGSEARAPHERRTAIVEAVDKTRGGIVSLNVVKLASWGRKEVLGTGVIIDERGYVVTNHHMIADAIKIVATLPDKSLLAAEVFADDPKHDLAILKLPTKRKLQTLTFGSGSDLMIGETVISIGNPYGYHNTVSTGVISALGRQVTMPSGEVLTNLTQHSASINPGSSGGPLLNINGEVIGINVALREGGQEIGFALNSETVQKLLVHHLHARKVSRVEHGLDCREGCRQGEGLPGGARPLRRAAQPGLEGWPAEGRRDPHRGRTVGEQPLRRGTGSVGLQGWRQNRGGLPPRRQGDRGVDGPLPVRPRARALNPLADHRGPLNPTREPERRSE